MCLVGTNLNQLRCFYLKLFRGTEGAAELKRKWHLGLCPPVPELAPLSFLFFLFSFFGTNLDFCWDLCFESFQRSCLLEDGSFLPNILCLSYLARVRSVGKGHPLSAQCPISKGSLESDFRVLWVTGPCTAYQSGVSSWASRPYPPWGHPMKRTASRCQSTGDPQAPLRFNLRQG